MKEEKSRIRLESEATEEKKITIRTRRNTITILMTVRISFPPAALQILKISGADQAEMKLRDLEPVFIGTFPVIQVTAILNLRIGDGGLRLFSCGINGGIFVITG
ncbi:MAG: hypothetical protein V8S22_06755 [Lachnospiraceae bacterium]